MSIEYAQSQSRLIQEAIDDLFAEFGVSVGNQGRITEQEKSDSDTQQLLRNYENGAFPNSRVILSHNGPIPESEITTWDIRIDLKTYQTWRLNPSEHLPRKPLHDLVEVSEEENCTCSICYDLLSPDLEVITLPCGHWFEWCCIKSCAGVENADGVGSGADNVGSGTGNVGFGADHVGFCTDDVWSVRICLASGVDDVGSCADQVVFGADNVGFDVDYVGLDVDNVGFGAEHVGFAVDDVGFPGKYDV
ncbi:hypothetical protein N7490_005029 [Penicillium lividum]|nr:hypothetical protein N7490_005029 [Penicillium lividum]